MWFTIGVGLTGSLAALELAKQGLKVVGLERGAPRDTVPDFQSPAIHDELRFSIRKGMMQDNVKEAVTFSQQLRPNCATDPPLGKLFARDRPRGFVRALEPARLTCGSYLRHFGKHMFVASLSQADRWCSLIGQGRLHRFGWLALPSGDRVLCALDGA